MIDTGVSHEAELSPQGSEPPPLSAGPSDVLRSKPKRTQTTKTSKKCAVCTGDKQKASYSLTINFLANIKSKCVWSRGFDAKCDRCERLRYNCSEAPQISSDGDRQRRKLDYTKCDFCRKDRKKVSIICRICIMKCSDHTYSVIGALENGLRAATFAATTARKRTSHVPSLEW